MSTVDATTTCPTPLGADCETAVGGRLRRWLLAGVGVGFVGIGAVGVVVPGLPTTIFLIIASACFARSCPALERRLIRNRFFRPFHQYMEPGARMPARAKAISMAMMWTAIVISSTMILLGDGSPIIVAIIVAAGFVGTWFIVRR